MNNKSSRLIILLCAIFIFLFSLCFATSDASFIPGETFRNIGAMIGSIFGKHYDISAYPYMAQTIARLKISSISFVSGAAICLPGALYQTIFKNPIASPNILGISTGVSIGNVAFIFIFQLNAYSYLRYRYLMCYGAAMLIILLTIVLGRFSGRNGTSMSVETIIIMGMMINHLGGVINTYFRYLLEGDETGLAELLSTLTAGNTIYIDNESFIVFCIAMSLGMIPLLLLRYRFNALAFDDAESYSMGISNRALRNFGLAGGALLAAAAIVHCGDVGFLSMVIPFICRKRFDADFREIAFMSICFGSIFSILARIVYEALAMSLSFIIPAGDILTLVLLPIFVYVLLKERRS